MCGIVGSIGSENAKEVVLSGLSQLEYRGYDSAGMALSCFKTLEIYKKEGKLQNLIEFTQSLTTPYSLGIGHTRWATHGAVNETNCHPHYNKEKSIAVVHNGIIENYQELKQELIALGYSFYSQTDTEVIANLIDYYFDQDYLSAIQQTVNRLQGAYALGIIFENNPVLYAVKHHSPLVLGKSNNTGFIASDVSAFIDYTQQVYYLEDGQLAQLTGNEVKLYDTQLNQIKFNFVDANVENNKIDKTGFDHFMLKEIFEQPQIMAKTLQIPIHLKLDIDRYQQIYLVACGTAYHAGLIAKNYFEKMSDCAVWCEMASEFRYREPKLSEKTLVIAISQSGETADTLQALKMSKQHGTTTVAITNVVQSSLAREADFVIYTQAGKEISVASTKAYTAQLLTLLLLASDLFNQPLNQLERLPQLMNNTLTDLSLYQLVAQHMKDQSSVFYIGRLLDYVTALEGALKLKEISYIHSEAFAAGELKHGPIALIEENTPVIGIACDAKVIDKIKSNLQEVKARHAYCVVITLASFKDYFNFCDQIITIPDCDVYTSPLLSAISIQLLAYFVTLSKGYDVDKPRNLAKSVTVE